MTAALLLLAFWFTTTSDTKASFIVLEIGNAELDDTALNAGQTIIGGTSYSFISSGTVPTGLSFTITTTSTGDGGAPNDQTGGLGIFSGRANQGIDNNSNNTGGTNPTGDYSEELTFTISGVTGGVVQFHSFDTAFGNDNSGTEWMSVNGGSPILVTSGTDDFVSGTTLSVRAVSQNVQNFDNRFVVDQIVLSVAIPEPSTVIVLGGLGGLLCLLYFARRRKQLKQSVA
ncbi:MAG: PEP-CTERM sorting domain-containing protein [Verrucomicrobiota bacterium]